MKSQLLRRWLVAVAILSGIGNPTSAQAPAREPHQTQTGHSEAVYRGGLVTPPLPKPRFTLTDTSGAPFDFWSKTQGHVTLLFFGYTHCPDVCPVHMTFLATALKKMPSGSADQFDVVFVTTDPVRDSPKVLCAWLDNFDKRFIGLTGSESAIEAAQVAAKVPPARMAGSAGGGSEVGHAAFVIAYTKDNFAHVIYPSGVSQEDWAHDLPELAKEHWTQR